MDEFPALPVPVTHGDPIEHRRLLAERVNQAQLADGSTRMAAPLKVASYTVADLATAALAASLWESSIVYVSDEAGGATLAFSDGTNWRRAQDRAIVS